MKRLQDYTMVVRPDTNGTFVAYLPAIPGCHAWGETSEAASSELFNVFEMIQEEYLEEGRLLKTDRPA
jgi:predicted RNase H-like HicB family nuclease